MNDFFKNTKKSHTFTCFSKEDFCDISSKTSNKEKLLLQRKELKDLISKNFTIEADFVFIIQNNGIFFRKAKEIFNDIVNELKIQNKLAISLYLLNNKEEKMAISQPFKEFNRNSLNLFKSFIEARNFQLENEDFPLEKHKKIQRKDIFTAFDFLKKIQWTSKKARICLFFCEFEQEEAFYEEILQKYQGKNVAFYLNLSENSLKTQEEEEKAKETPLQTLKFLKNSSEIHSEIEKTCIKFDLKILEEKTKKNPLISSKSCESSVFLELPLDSTPPNWLEKSFKLLHAKAHSFFIVKDKGLDIDWASPYIQTSSIETHFWLNPQPFSFGAMRYAFYLKDVVLNEKLVGKIPKVLDENYNLNFMRKDAESMIFLEHLIIEFNQRMVFRFQSPTILNVVHCYIYEVLTPDFPYRYLWVENLLEGDYKKFNNNSGWQDSAEDEYNLMAQAFSHFTWQFTKGYLIIVDLQGIFGVFTDPQIHCLDVEKFGIGNFGRLGMVRFFMTHQCNKFCRELGLVHLNDEPAISEGFWKQNKEMNMEKLLRETGFLIRLCDLCGKPYKVSKKEFCGWKNDRRWTREDYCILCTNKNEEEMTYGGACEECGKKFWYSKYWFRMKRTEKPTRCSMCRKNKRDRERKRLIGI